MCEFNSCFIIAGLEFLETEKRANILDILNNYFAPNEKNKMNSYLIFLFMNYNSDIFKSLSLKSYRQILEIENGKLNRKK